MVQTKEIPVKRKSSKGFIYILVLILLLTYVPVTIYLYSHKDETKKCDAAIVLGAAIRGEKPSPVFEERINHAIYLYNNNFVKKIIFTGGRGEEKKYSEAYVAKLYAVENGIPEKDIYLEEKSTITEENIEFSIRIISEQNIDSVLIVSDPLHMKRAMSMAEDYGLNAFPSPTTTSLYTSIKSKAGFLARESLFYIGYKVDTLFK